MPSKQSAGSSNEQDVASFASSPDHSMPLTVDQVSSTRWRQGSAQEDLEKGVQEDETERGVGDLEQQNDEHDSSSDADQEEDGKCRVCHLVYNSEHGSRETMQLGCNCKEDLAMAHPDCAEAWFKIKGNRVCEICGVTAQNVLGNEDNFNFMEQWNDRDASTVAEQQRRCWQSLSLCNFFLACMVVTFILLWLFRVTIS